MNRVEKLLKECEKLKTLIKNLENKPPDIHQETVWEMQLKFLKLELSKVGKQLNCLTLYKRDCND